MMMVLAFALQGDPAKIEWTRPYGEAVKAAKASGRPLFAKPIMGGGTKPKEGGRLAGGANDCDGGW